MKRTSSILVSVVFGGVALAGTAGVVQQWRETARLRERVAVLQRDATSLEHLRAENERLRLAELPATEVERLRADDAAVARTRAEIAQLREKLVAGKAASAAARVSAEARRATNVAAPSVSGSDKPASRLTPESARAKVSTVYADLLATLPAAEATALKNLLADRMHASVEAPYRAMDAGEDPNTPEVKEAVGAAQLRVEAKILNQLGAGVFGAYQQFEQTLNVRGVLAGLQRMLEANGTPLKPEQRERLSTILQEAAHASYTGYQVPRGPAPRYRVRLTDEIMRAAEAVLTAEQLRVFRLFRAQHERVASRGR